VTRYSFLGHPVPDTTALRFSDGLTLRDDDNATHVVRLRTERLMPVVCRCGHRERLHGTDRGGHPRCYGSPICGCSEYRGGAQ
jgi:hypothetical protein